MDLNNRRIGKDATKLRALGLLGHSDYGYLGAGHRNQKAGSEYICVDRNAEAFTRGRADNDGKLLYIVKSICGSLPCPPYDDNKSVTCVVCSNDKLINVLCLKYICFHLFCKSFN